MNPLYLSRIALKDFRTFGDFAIDIPPAPGLTLLVGTNGLGKSNFFDGIEWCLTGEVRRFENYVGRLKEAEYLTRRDAEANSHQVTLQFDRNKPLIRSSTAKPGDATLIELLKSADWNEIGELKAYLAFTHFLGQAAQQRFTSRKQNDQWEALKGPSGIDRLEEIRLALRGAPTTNAFRKRTDAEQLRLDQAEKALVSWREACERLARLRDASALIGVVPEPTLITRLETLYRDFAAQMDGTKELPEGDLATRLGALRQEIQTALERTSQETAGLGPLRAVVTSYLTFIPESDADGAELEAARTAVSDATATVTMTELAVLEAERSAAAHRAEKAALDAESDRLAALRQFFGEQARLIGERAAIVVEKANIAAEETGTQTAHAAAGVRLTAVRANLLRRTALEAQLSALNEIAVRARGLTALEMAHRACQATAAAARQPAADATARIGPLRERLAALDTQIAASDQAVEALRAKASDIADALARLAGHISEHDENCPLCFSSFEPGILQTLAATAAEAQNRELAEHARRHQNLIEQRTELTAEIAAAQQAIITHATDAAAEVAALTALTNARADVARSLDATDSDDLSTMADARVQTVSAELSSLLAAEAAGALTVASAEADLAARAAELSVLNARKTDADHRLLAADNALRVIEERLAVQPQPLMMPSDIERLIDAHQVALAAAQRHGTQLAEQLTGAHADRNAAQQRAVAAQNALDIIAKRIEVARQGLDAAIAQWKAGGLDGPPSEIAIQQRLNGLAHRSAELTTMLDRHLQIAQGLDGLHKQKELQALIANMELDAGAGATENTAIHERELQNRVAAARKTLQLTQATQEAVKAYSEKLKEEADRFSSQFLQPLNDMVVKFNRALLSTPGETVQFNADHAVNRTQLDMQLRYADVIENEIYNRQLPPQLVLSEGQMAANGFSILCAASTAYPWSNWRALLLDDPLQHNDVIHAAAFVDLMRNLVEMRSYQLLMSTHDRAEGEFLARKFDAANLPCTVVALTAPSKEGVLSEAPRYNEAARAIMRSRLDQAV